MGAVVQFPVGRRQVGRAPSPRLRQLPLHLGVEALSPRERQVLERRALGEPYKVLAGNLSISIHTAKQHATRAFSKLGVSTSLEAVRFLLVS
jgi:DNA-binding CsgD family transcriptional regulator